MSVMFIAVRTNPHYRSEAFAAGARAAGYVPKFEIPRTPHADDVFVTWNRHGANDAIAERFRRVVVVENGYVPMIGTTKTFAMALNQHNGPGVYPSDGPDRSRLLDVRAAPAWRNREGYILVLPQRGIGSRLAAMPRGWTDDVTRRLRALTRREIRVRIPPSTGIRSRSLDEDLEHARAAVVWASSAGIKAMLAGVPTFHELPGWIGARASAYGIGGIGGAALGESMGSVETMLRHVAAAQWTVEEVASGEAFKALLK